MYCALSNSDLYFHSGSIERKGLRACSFLIGSCMLYVCVNRKSVCACVSETVSGGHATDIIWA